jgi:hypothetical protein
VLGGVKEVVGGEASCRVTMRAWEVVEHSLVTPVTVESKGWTLHTRMLHLGPPDFLFTCFVAKTELLNVTITEQPLHLIGF